MFKKAAVLLTALASLMLPLAGSSSAATTRSGTTAAGASSASSVQLNAAAACPTWGARVKTPNSDRIYLVDPEGRLRPIPDATTYFRLWDTWSYTTISDSLLDSCYPQGVELRHAKLVKSSRNSAIYIYDWTYNNYRWITSEEVFNRYGFSWAKVIEVNATVSPTGPNWYR